MLEETRPTGHGRARGLVSSRASGRRIEARTFAPSPELSHIVDRYWMSRWDLRGQPAHLTELLADPCVNIAFEATRSRVVGVSTRLFRRELSGVGLIRAVKLRAGAARALLRARSVSSFSDRVLPLASLFGDAVVDLESRILSAEDEREGLSQLESWLSAQISCPLDPNIGFAVKVVERIAGDPSITTAGQIASLAGLSIRPLQRLFREYVGASPKWVVRRFRLQEAALRLEQGPSTSLATLAVELGYSDHAHLSRDFKSATGRSPKEFARSVWK